MRRYQTITKREEFMRLSSRIESIEDSKTAMFLPLVRELRAKGRRVINLAIGEPDFKTPGEVIQVTKEALDQNRTRYSEIAGLPELKKKIAAQHAHHGCRPENIVVSNGSKQSLFAVFQVLLDPGDEVIIPAPCWVSFPQQVRLAGGQPIMVATRDHQLDCDAIEEALGPRTRAILINSPNNPTGAVYPKNDLERIIQIARERELMLISDEAYGFFTYDAIQPQDATLLGLSPTHAEDLHRRLIVVRSFSKHYSMTGFRIGYLVGPPKFAAAVSKLQGHLSGNVCTFAQHGAIRALSLNHDLMEERRQILERRRNLALTLGQGLFDCIKPQGSFYIFPNITGSLKSGQSSRDFCMQLLRNFAVAVVPGEDFGTPGHMRISYAVAEDDLKEGFRRIREVMA
jgi:aspartate aminotransferase